VEPDQEEMIAIFASDRSLQLLSTANILAVDGTFFTCPKPFLQLFVLQVLQDKFYFLNLLFVKNI